jgi:hypothetical protein
VTALAFVLAAAGALLLWTAATGDDPRDIVAGVFRGPAGTPKARGVRAK